MAVGAGYAISQLKFPGPAPVLVDDPGELHDADPVADRPHFILMSQFHWINTLPGVIAPQLIAPGALSVIIYKQFFDSVPKDFREAAVIDGASEFQLLFRIYLPMNWGITTALAIITFIGAWNLFLWPFVAVNTEDKMNITVGITQVHDAFGVCLRARSRGRDARGVAGRYRLSGLPAPGDAGDHAVGGHQGLMRRRATNGKAGCRTSN